LRALNDVLVDTGSELTWIPRPLLENLGIAAERRYRLVVATGQVVEREIGFAIVPSMGSRLRTTSCSPRTEILFCLARGRWKD
jgi:predicted aspartyl protease